MIGKWNKRKLLAAAYFFLSLFASFARYYCRRIALRCTTATAVAFVRQPAFDDLLRWPGFTLLDVVLICLWLAGWLDGWLVGYLAGDARSHEKLLTGQLKKT